jgi:anti-sigma regulatory factor (Ser/Thr protein kinase)/serine/threonine protein phosphatase PrpC
MLQPVTIDVADPLHVKQAASRARDFAASLGFAEPHCEQIALVVTELGTNLVRHAHGGMVKLSEVQDSGRIGIQVETEDSGPGIPDIERAMTDGFTTGGSLGFGLGTVNRLMDDLEIYSRMPRGVHVISHRWMRPQRSELRAHDLQFGAASRAYRFMAENGDAFVIIQWERYALAGVIDGLGHGPFAQRAAHTARQYIEQHFDQPLEAIFRGVQRACRATRGVVMALVRFDMAQQKFTVASVGNIEVRLFNSPEHFGLIVRRGVIGLNAPTPVLLEHAWEPNCILVIHSDGLRTHWNMTDFPELASAPPEAIAQRLLQALGKMEDDATVVVARSMPPRRA